ncbi:hypothetical protein G6011_11303 [Alternaria panax]|uniref:Uncharacterized protein n=1 Tax=Alternaria panax TaxID=48097 RepID=A0AAD4IDM6_9PLEO|nr:hypothetical protein G6011_11303 [Alternaria panax]
MASISLCPSPGHTIKAFLKIFLIAWESAITAYRPYSISSFGPSHFGEKHLKVTIDFSSRGGWPEGATEAEKIAFTTLYTCDIFCAMFLKVVRARLEPYQASVEYILVLPKPLLTLVPGDEKPNVLHAILLVTTKEYSEIIFDGTGEQFFWPKSSAIIDGEEFWDLYANEKVDEKYIQRYSLGEFEKADNGYWFRVGISLHQMLSDLDWESFGETLSPVREEQIRAESERRARAAAKVTWG